MSDSNLLQYNVDRDLLNPNFDGYKLSLESYAVNSLRLTSKLFRPKIKQSQYSLLHQHLFFTHNFLTFDEWENNSNILQAYTVLEDCGVYCLNYFKDTARSEAVKVFDFGNKKSEQECYNATIFLTSKFALISNGSGALWLCDRRNKIFQVLYTTSNVLNGNPFTIVDFVEKSQDNEKRQFIDCLLKSVVESDQKPGSFANQFYWITFFLESDQWKIFRTRIISTKNVVQYCSLSRSNKVSTVCLLNSGPVEFLEDSEKPVVKPEPTPVNDSQSKVYFWRQNDGELIVTSDLGQNAQKSDVTFDLDSKKINISLAGCEKPVICGELFDDVDANSLHWSVDDNGSLEIRLTKREKNSSWTEFIKGDFSGEYIADPMLAKAMSDRLMDFTTVEESLADPFNSRPAFNAEDIEECDVVPTDALCLTWLDGDSHQILRSVDMGGHQWLFTAKIHPNEPPYLGMRFDVDGILWRIPSDPLELGVSPSQGTPPARCSAHCVTFDAFGYVEAAKESRQLVTCSPGAVYAVIADQRRNIYIYWRNKNISGQELKNRKTGQIVQTVCKQSLLTIEADQQILGLSALDDFLLVLTDSHLHVFTLGTCDVL